MTDLQRGQAGELRAVRYLRKKKYKILTTNYHCRFGEVDIIATKDNTLIFVEVKTRHISSTALPREAVDFHKQQRIIKASLCYIKQYNFMCDIRYDVVEVLVDPKHRRALLHHIENAF